MGARLSTLVYAFVKNGGVSPRHMGLFAAMLGSSIARTPIGWIERLVARRQREYGLRLQDPIFIIGHWRSGTTHLHNLLAQSPALGYITPLASGLPDQMLTLAKWFKPWLDRALPADRYVDNVAVTPTSPQEDEIPLANQHALSVFHAVYFPRKFHQTFRRAVFLDGVSAKEQALWGHRLRCFLEKVVWHQNQSLLILKNPVYTARISKLLQLFPKARFIYIRRNPFEVYASTLLYYKRLFRELALQDYHHIDLEVFVETTYLELMQQYAKQAKALSREQLAEVSFEQLESDPIDVLKHLHVQLHIPGWQIAQPRISRYIEDIAGYQKNHLVLTEAQKARVQSAWGQYVDQWEYNEP